MLVFGERGKLEYPEKKVNQQRTQTTCGINNGLEPGLHWWEAGSFNAGPSLSPQYAVNPLSTPPPLIPLLGKNVNKPLPSPPPFLFFTTKLRNDRLYWLNTTVMLRVDWSGMAYSHAGSADFFFFFYCFIFLSLAAWPPNFMHLIFFSFHSSYLRRSDTIILT